MYAQPAYTDGIASRISGTVTTHGDFLRRAAVGMLVGSSVADAPRRARAA